MQNPEPVDFSVFEYVTAVKCFDESEPEPEPRDEIETTEDADLEVLSIISHTHSPFITVSPPTDVEVVLEMDIDPDVLRAQTPSPLTMYAEI